jgi:hypothetical protein
MNGQVVEISREKLYERVWSEPISKIAPEYNLSDVGLAKICKRHYIPRPSLGYWAKLQHGYKVKKAPLPRLKDDKDDIIRITIAPQKEKIVDPDQEKNSQDLLTQIPELLKTVVAGTEPPDSHPLIESARSNFRNVKTDKRGIIEPRAAYHLSISVTQTSLDRALDIMARLVQIVESMGGRLYINKESPVSTCVEILGEVFPISLTEKIDEKERPLTEAEEIEKNRFGFFLFREKDYFPTGILSLRVLCSGVSGIRQKWMDTSNSRLEDRMGTIAKGLVKTAVSLRSEKLEAIEAEKRRTEEKRRQAENYQRWQELQEKIKIEREKVNGLHQQAQNWAKSQELRAFIEAAVKSYIGKNGTIEADSDFEKWIKWAREQADRLDPLVTSPHSILDEDTPRPLYSGWY